MRLSKVASMPAAPSPLRTKMLSVLKVSKFWLPAPRLIWSASVPPFGARRIDVVEMLEVGRVFQLAERREPMRFGLGLRRRESGASRAKRGERGGAGEKGAARNPSPRKAGRGRLAPRVLPSASPRTGSAERVRGRGRELPRPLTPTLSPQAGRGGSLAAACHILHRCSLTPAPLRCGRGGSELVRHRGAPVLAAFSASYHQIVGKPEPPYSGRSFGLAKRSQRAVRVRSE